jgi:hypothetical protein
MSLLRKATFGKPTLLRPAVSNLSPGKSLLAPGKVKKVSRLPPVASDPTPPGTPLHWFDLTDTGSLWTDAGGTMPVTVDGETILNITNKGSAAEDLNTLFASAEGPTYKTAGLPAGSITGAALFADATEDSIYTEVDSLVNVENVSIACVFAAEETASSQAVFAWDDFDAYMGIASNHNAEFYISGAELTDGSATMTADTWGAVIAYTDDEATPNTTLEQSWTETTETATHALDISPSASGNLALGRYTASNLFQYEGWIVEVIIWTGTLTAQEVADYKTYVTDKYGITWT